MNNSDFIIQNASSYTNEYSNFPYDLIIQHHFKDADDSIASLINEINDLKARGLYDLASKKIREYSTTLSRYNIDAETINIIEEEIRNTQVMAKQKHQCIYIQDSEPELCCSNDVWLGS